jgi:hypothetical protein
MGDLLRGQGIPGSDGLFWTWMLEMLSWHEVSDVKVLDVFSLILTHNENFRSPTVHHLTFLRL